jgi:hypothetical protein
LASDFKKFFDLLIQNLFIPDLFPSTLAAIVKQFSPYVDHQKQFGFSLLYSIASGSTIPKNDFKTTAMLMHRLSAFGKNLFSSLASLSSSAIIAISGLLSETHASCDDFQAQRTAKSQRAHSPNRFQMDQQRRVQTHPSEDFSRLRPNPPRIHNKTIYHNSVHILQASLQLQFL